MRSLRESRKHDIKYFIHAYKQSYCTHEALGLATVLDLDDRLRVATIDNLEGEVLHVGYDLRIGVFATDEALGVEDGVDRVHGDLVLRSISNETLGVREGHIGRSGTVALVVGNDFNTIVLPHADAPAKQEKKMLSSRSNRVQKYELTSKWYPSRYRLLLLPLWKV